MRFRGVTICTFSLMSFILTACGGGGGGGADSAAISGKVIDGYIQGARVCLDVNANLVCDASEPSTVTDAQGGYSLNYAGDTTGMHILALVPAGAMDSDLGEITKPFDLLTPAAEPSVISPLTTLVSSEMISSAETLESAKATVKALVGADVLGYDFKQSNDSDTLLVAQVTAAAFAATKDAMAAADSQSSLNAAELLKLAIEETKVTVLPFVLTADGKAKVSAATSQSALLTNLTQVHDVQSSVVGRISQIVARAKAGFGEAEDLETLLKGQGMVLVQEGDTRLKDGTYVSTTASAEHVVLRNPGKRYALAGSPLVWEEEWDWNDSQHFFNGTTWQVSADADEQYEFEGTNCVYLLPAANSSVKQKVCLVTRDISGRKISDFVADICQDQYNPNCNSDNLLPTGSWGADLTFTQTADYYRIWSTPDWQGYAPDLSAFGTSMTSNNRSHYVGDSCNTEFTVQEASGDLGVVGTKGKFKWWENAGNCNSGSRVANTLEVTAFEVVSVGGKPVVKALMPNLYRRLNPGERNGYLIFAQVDTDAEGAPNGMGVYSGNLALKGTKVTIPFTGDISRSMQVLSRTAFDAILSEGGYADFPYTP